MPALIYRVTFELDPEDIYDGDPKAISSTYVLNSAQNERGFEYFDAVDGGRKGFTHGSDVKALHWVEAGEDVFRDSVGPAVARNLRSRAMENAQGRLAALVKSTKVSSRAQLEDLGVQCAQILLEEVQALTPVRYTGTLRSSYSVSDTEGGSAYEPASVYDNG